MAWGTQEQKGDLLKMGAQAFFGELQKEFETNRILRDSKKDGDKIDPALHEYIWEENERLESMVNNLLYDTELGCKYKKTEEIFLEIIQIIMLDLESDNMEIISNFTKAFDTEEFIESHNQAVKKRQDRLDEEYGELMKEYEIQMSDYRRKKEEHKSKSFFSKIFADDIIEPEKPERRK